LCVQVFIYFAGHESVVKIIKDAGAGRKLLCWVMSKRDMKYKGNFIGFKYYDSVCDCFKPDYYPLT